MGPTDAGTENVRDGAGGNIQELSSAVLGSISRAVSVTSGKGGVGKTSIVANLAIGSALRGRRVLIIDCDLGLSNIDVQMGLNPPYNLIHALAGKMDVEEVMVTAAAGVKVLPAPFGLQEFTNLSPEQKLSLMALLEKLQNSFELIFLDTGAGISSNVMFFNLMANHVVVILTPEPSSMTDAYALIKVMKMHHGKNQFHLLVNNARTATDGLTLYRKFTGVVYNFLDVSVDYVGCIPHDSMFTKATLLCRPLVELYPRSSQALNFLRVAERMEKLVLAARTGTPFRFGDARTINENGDQNQFARTEFLSGRGCA